MPDLISNQSGLPTSFDVGVPTILDYANIVDAFKYYHYGPNLDGVDGIEDHLSSIYTNINNIIPIQGPSNAGKFLKTDGTSISWATVDAFPLQTGNSGKYLTTNGTTVSWSTINVLPSQTDNNGKYLKTNGTSSSWSLIDKIEGIGSSATALDNEFKIYVTNPNPSPALYLDINLISNSVSNKISLDAGDNTNNISANINITTNSLYLFAGTVSQYSSISLTNGQVDISGTASTTIGKTTSSTILMGSSFNINGVVKELGLPSQTSNSGKFLTTNGTSSSWATITQIPSQTSNSGKFLTTDGTNPSWAYYEENMIIAISDEISELTAGAGKFTIRAPYGMTFTKIPRAFLTTASSSGLVTINIKKNGSTIFSTNLSIDANEKTSLTANTAAVLSSSPTIFANDDEITFDIDSAGAGAVGLKIILYYVKS